MSNDISLVQSQRDTLLALSGIDRFLTRTQLRLASGREVNSVADSPTDFFQISSLRRRAQLFLERRDQVEQSVSSLQAQLDGLESIDSLLGQLRGLVIRARAESQEQRIETTQNFQEVGEQIQTLLNDISYQGLNLLRGNQAQLQTRFSEATESDLTINGVDLRSTAFQATDAERTLLGGLFDNAFLDRAALDVNLTALGFIAELAQATPDSLGFTLPGGATTVNNYVNSHIDLIRRGVINNPTSATANLVETFTVELPLNVGGRSEANVQFRFTIEVIPGTAYDTSGDNFTNLARAAPPVNADQFPAGFTLGDITELHILGRFDGFTRIGAAQEGLALTDAIVAQIEQAQERIETISARFANALEILQTRSGFAEQYATRLNGGADRLELADTAEEATLLTALRTRNQLAIQQLAISGQNQQAILALFATD